MPLDMVAAIGYNMFMSNDNILAEFTSFIAKSAAQMESPIASPGLPSPVGARSPALVSPSVMAPSLPRTAAMSSGEAPAPAPITNPSKPLKPTNFNPSSK